MNELRASIMTDDITSMCDELRALCSQEPRKLGELDGALLVDVVDPVDSAALWDALVAMKEAGRFKSKTRVTWTMPSRKTVTVSGGVALIDRGFSVP